ncbi:MAG TPA: DegT/DnrJ/EryC1/StrS aminotransferase family protein [Gemmatimonadales bacterium]|nr:DegT/DnrJ/EryC1/StrS aminotransferase family protein [Gemmatimonadales bacterium]
MIHIAAPDLSELEMRYVTEAMASGWISGRGPFVARFERAFAEFSGAAHGVACSSGTTALHLLLAALDIGPGDEVVVPAFTMIGTVNPVLYLRATPVVADADPGTWNVTADSVRAVVTSHTKAIIVTHVYGLPADVESIQAAAPNIPVLEDAAEAHGARCRGRRVGSLGRGAAFSFYANKIVTTGEGGMVTTDDEAVAARCRRLRDHAFGPDAQRYLHDEIGFSYRLSNLQAAVGLGQAERAEALVARSRAVGLRYLEALGGVPGLRSQVAPPWAEHVYWVFGVAIEEGFGVTRSALRAGLSARGIGTRDFFHPVHLQPALRGRFKNPQCPVAEQLGTRGLYLPSGPGRTDAEVDRVIAAVKEIAAGA